MQVQRMSGASRVKLPPYAALWSSIILPGYEFLRGRKTPVLERRLATSQWKDFEAMENRRWSDLQLLLEHVARTVPFYRDWFAANRLTVADIIAARNLDMLPLVDRSDMVSEPVRFTSDQAPSRSFHKATGGTTGTPFSFFLSPLSDHWRVAVSRRAYGWAGCVPGCRQVHLWSSDVILPPPFRRFKRSLHRALMRQKYISAFELAEPKDLDRAFTETERFHPQFIVAYPTAVAAMAKRMLATARRLSRPLQGVIGGGEAVFPDQRLMIEQAFGCPVFETYGNREFMLIGAECEQHRGLHLAAENLIVEVVKEGRLVREGEIGEVVITDLHNFAQAFIRYRTGDLSTRIEGPCPCGRWMPRIGRVEGRNLDMIRLPDGRILSGHYLPHFLQNFAAIRCFQVVQDREAHVTIRIVDSGMLPEEQRQMIVSRLEAALPGIHADLQTVSDVERTPTGKVRVTVGLGHATR